MAGDTKYQSTSEDGVTFDDPTDPPIHPVHSDSATVTVITKTKDDTRRRSTYYTIKRISTPP